MNNKFMSHTMKQLKRKPVHLIPTVTAPILSKYAPKYCKKLDVPSISGSLCSKVKKIKKLEHLDSRCNKKLRLELLKDKRRQVKTLLPDETTLSLRYYPNIPKYSLNILSKRLSRAFLLLRGIKTLTLTIPENSQTKSYSEHFTWRFWKHFGSLNNLKHLKLMIPFTLSPTFYEFFKNLDSLDRYYHILRPLQSLEVNLELSSDCTISPKELSFPNLMRHVTNLHMEYDSAYFQRGFMESIQSFRNINSLFLNLRDTKHLDFKYLEVFQELHLLNSFDLRVRVDSNSKFKDFLNYVTFPTSLKDLIIELDKINWDDFFPNYLEQICESNNPFELDPDCVHFYNKWTQLQSLESLRLSFLHIQDQDEIISSVYFIVPLLKKISSLTILYYSNKAYGRRQIKSIDFAWFLKEIAHLSLTLRVIEIEDFQLSLGIMIPDALSCFNLEELQIFALITGDTEVGTLCKLLSEMRENTPVRQIMNLEYVDIESGDSFVLFLKGLKKFARNRDLELEIWIDVKKVRLDQLYRSLIDYIKEGHPLQNLALCIGNVDTERINWNEIKELQNKYKTFKTLELVEIDILFGDNFDLTEEESEEFDESDISDEAEAVDDLDYQ